MRYPISGVIRSCKLITTILKSYIICQFLPGHGSKIHRNCLRNSIKAHHQPVRHFEILCANKSQSKSIRGNTTHLTFFAISKKGRFLHSLQTSPRCHTLLTNVPSVQPTSSKSSMASTDIIQKQRQYFKNMYNNSARRSSSIATPV